MDKTKAKFTVRLEDNDKLYVEYITPDGLAHSQHNLILSDVGISLGDWRQYCWEQLGHW